MARNGPITIGDLRAAQEQGIEQGRNEALASHDNRQFKSVPATGPRGDQPAGQQWKDLLKDESLLKTVDRLKASASTRGRGGAPGQDMSGYGSDWPDIMGGQDDEPGTDPVEVLEQLELPLDLVKQLQISPNEVAQLLLPGEKGGDAGLGSMSWDDVQKHMKQNPGSAEKLLKKWKQLKGGINLPLASIPESYRREGIGNPFDTKMQEYNRNLPSDERIRILNEAIKLRA